MLPSRIPEYFTSCDSRPLFHCDIQCIPGHSQRSLPKVWFITLHKIEFNRFNWYDNIRRNVYVRFLDALTSYFTTRHPFFYIHTFPCKSSAVPSTLPPPEEYDNDTLRRLCLFCQVLHQLSWPSQQDIVTVAQNAIEVHNPELASAALKRHLKESCPSGDTPPPAAVPSTEDTRPLVSLDRTRALWYVLDYLSKQHGAEFKVFLQADLPELALEAIPWEHDTESPKYELLVDRWVGVFDPDVLTNVNAARRKRLWRHAHPAEYAERQAREETLWALSAAEATEAEGLDEYAMPCFRYLAGKCEENPCPRLHPAGEEGTLPPEARPGDWRCPHCATLNRHFRRRCYYCPGEKPQYRAVHHTPGTRTRPGGYPVLTPPSDPRFDVFSAQFGYDPSDTHGATRHWVEYFAHTPLEDYLNERSAAYRVRILQRAPRNELERELRTSAHFPDLRSVRQQFPITAPVAPQWVRQRGTLLSNAASTMEHGEMSTGEGVESTQGLGRLHLASEAIQQHSLRDCTSQCTTNATVEPNCVGSQSD